MAYNSKSRVPKKKYAEIGEINGRDRRENREGVARGSIQENERCNDRVEEVDELEVGSRKRKRRDSVSPLSRLIRSCRRSSIY